MTRPYALGVKALETRATQEISQKMNEKLGEEKSTNHGVGWYHLYRQSTSSLALFSIPEINETAKFQTKDYYFAVVSVYIPRLVSWELGVSMNASAQQLHGAREAVPHVGGPCTARDQVDTIAQVAPIHSSQ